MSRSGHQSFIIAECQAAVESITTKAVLAELLFTWICTSDFSLLGTVVLEED